ncbi:hypothetical protein EV363DRAFT_1257845, partial [Boletus edulis]
MSSPLIPFVVRNYAETRRRYPTEGRRRWKLRVAQQFWAAVGSGGAASRLYQPTGDVVGALPELTSTAESDSDPDSLDGVTRDAPELGLIVRTDFSDEPSWAAFCTHLQDSEQEFVLGNVDVDENGSKQPDGMDNGGEDDSEDEDDPPAIFRIINPSSPQERELLANISNLAALRLLNDVDVRPSPMPPQGAKRIDPPNRLVDYCGWQEFYRGKSVWIYDTKSNTDQCVRVVSQSGDMYGTATGDSWRARVPCICELQVNLSSGAMRIDFGGLDRWDFNERRRNMMEAEGE